MHSTAHLQLSNKGPFDTVVVKSQPIGSRVTSARCSGSSSPPVPESVRSPRRPHLAPLLQGAEVASQLTCFPWIRRVSEPRGEFNGLYTGLPSVCVNNVWDCSPEIVEITGINSVLLICSRCPKLLWIVNNGGLVVFPTQFPRFNSIPPSVPPGLIAFCHWIEDTFKQTGHF